MFLLRGLHFLVIQRVFGVLLLVAFVKMLLPIFLKIMNFFSGVVAAFIQFQVKNAEVHGFLLAALFGFVLSAVNWYIPLGARTHFAAVFTWMFATFLHDALCFEVVRKQDQNEELAKRVRRALRVSMLFSPLIPDVISYYAFHRETYLVNELVQVWLHRAVLLQEVLAAAKQAFVFLFS